MDYLLKPVMTVVCSGGLALALGVVARFVASGAMFSCLHSGFNRLQQVLTCMKGPVADDEVLSLVRERLQKQVLRSLLILFHVLCFAMLPKTASVLRELLLEGQCQAMDLLPVMLQGYCATVALVPSLITVRTVDGLCSVPVLLSVATILIKDSPEAYRKYMWDSMCTLIVVIMVRRTVATPTRPLFFLAALLQQLSLLFQQIQYPEADWRIFIGAMALCLMTFLSARLVDRGLVNVMACSLQVQGMQELHGAACALLRSCCDVVVELDCEGAITNNARSLGCFLLRDGGPGLQGTPLADLIVDEVDQVALSKRLFAPRPTEAQMAETMHASMRDGNNSLLRCELLWFHYRRLNGDLNCMVGIREFSDTATEKCMAAEDSRVEALASRDRTEVSEGPTLFNSGMAKAVLDSTQPGLPLKCLSTAFCAQLGPLPRNARLLDYVRHPEAFETWLKLSISAAVHGIGGPEDEKVTLLLPQGRLQITARCGLVKTMGDEEQEPETMDLSSVCIVFQEVKFRQKRGNFRKRTGFSSETSEARLEARVSL